MFKSPNSDEAVLKVIDFGYSCFSMREGDLVLVTGTPLWCAPENNGDEVTVNEAKRMDVYSFALVCCWILFFDTVSPTNGIESKMKGLSIAKKIQKENVFLH
jgi:serine/threonine protein kinase